MSSPETRNHQPVITEILEAHEAEIRSCARLVEIVPNADRNEQLLLANNFAFLTGDGFIPPAEYFALLERCAASGNFTELALLFHHSELQKTETYIRNHSDLPEEGNEHSETRELAELREYQSETAAALQGLEMQIAAQKPIALHFIGGPSPREQPDWIVALDQSGLSITEAIASLEKKTSKRSIPGSILSIRDDAHDGAMQQTEV